MSLDEVKLGTVRRIGNCFEARIERMLEHDSTEVWKMLTDPNLLSQWLAPGEISLSKGGSTTVA